MSADVLSYQCSDFHNNYYDGSEFYLESGNEAFLVDSNSENEAFLVDSNSENEVFSVNSNSEDEAFLEINSNSEDEALLSSSKKNSRMKIVNFDKELIYLGLRINNFNTSKITTTTLFTQLNKKIDYKAAFYLLPITKIIMQQKRKASKCKLPHSDIPGSIISIKHYKETRGIIKSQTKGFKYCTSVDISSSIKNLNIFLYEDKMKITGSPSEDGKIGLEAANLLIDHLEHIQKIINKIKMNRISAINAIEWVIENTKGDPIIREYNENMGGLSITRKVKDYLVSIPIQLVPEEVDIDIVKFFISLVKDFTFHSEVNEVITSMLNIPDIIENNETPLKIIGMHFVMVNYNYHLGFKIDLSKLDQHIHGKNGFFSQYNNDVSYCGLVELPYNSSIINPKIKQKNGKVPRIIFICYKEGSITHSGPGGDIMRESYYLFMMTIAEIRDKIGY